MTKIRDHCLLDEKADWRDKLKLIVSTMRELSSQTDPQRMVQLYGKRMAELIPRDGLVALSRRDLQAPSYRITRSSQWKEAVNPWQSKDRLPQFDRGLLGELLYGDEPRIIDDLEIAPDDPAAEYFAGMRSLVAIPLYDKGVAINMVVLLSREPGTFRHESLPEHVWMSNLFGMATQTLVMADKAKSAYEVVDREMQIVADIQRSLLPVSLPEIPGLRLAAHYQTSTQAGGDYYDFFPLPGGKWGILIADVSGHGTPAAVFMAVTHSIAHTHDGPPEPPGRLLSFINHHLTARYTTGSGTFVTAFYGIYDPAKRSITYASAGHPTPRVRHADGSIDPLNSVSGLPLGINPDERYDETTATFKNGDVVVFYTDGITEAHGSGVIELFGTERLDKAIRPCVSGPGQFLEATLKAVDEFTRGAPANDDRTLLVMQVADTK
ncbi:MAG: PP2C family protein-serine/threonine phosphatase [Planctomycetes bacterium]|nr:PP2C family protein-serine/threonine phosphatase [Planctomycetota bacterium]